MHLTPVELAAIFALKDWTYATGNGLEIPNAEMIQLMITRITDQLVDSGMVNAFATLGRFLVYKDPEIQGAYEIYLHVGWVPDPEYMTDEEREALGLDDEEDE